jgi:hypothetical protein
MPRCNYVTTIVTNGLFAYLREHEETLAVTVGFLAEEWHLENLIEQSGVNLTF